MSDRSKANRDISEYKLRPRQSIKKRNKMKEQFKPVKNDQPTTNAHSDALVQQHYNQIQDRGISVRNQSPTINIRIFNNWLKSAIFIKYIKHGDCILDLCCGKGGDLKKFKNCNINCYVGIDIADKSVKSAVERVNDDFSFPIQFLVGNCFTLDLDKGLPNAQKFDMVSCQFAVHYSFENEKKFNTMLTNVVSRLRKGGHFICTTTDAYVLIKKLRESESSTFGNEYYTAEFNSKQFPKEKGIFGNELIFSLTDSVNNCKEYLVHPQYFIEYAKKFDLHVVENLNFHDFYSKYENDEQLKHLLNYYKMKQTPLTKAQWDTIYLYRVFVFKHGSEEEEPQCEPKFSPKNPITEEDIKYIQ